MADVKTKPTDVSVEKFLNSIADDQRRADCFRLLEIMKEVTGQPPKMWGPSMVGFGSYHYVYASGHEGDIFVTGFSPRKDALTVYCMGGLQDGFAAQFKKLGKYKASKGCLYIKKLSEVDHKVLETLVVKSVAARRARRWD